MERTITHFKIYSDEPSQLAEFRRPDLLLACRTHARPGLLADFPHTNETGPLRCGVTHRSNSDFKRWLLYVNVAPRDETVKLQEELGGSVVRPKTGVPRVAWVANRRNSSDKEEQYGKDYNGRFSANHRKHAI
jgi:predicted enzyme related to lactoylglutathione lyase